jgi:hypothetical protein
LGDRIRVFTSKITIYQKNAPGRMLLWGENAELILIRLMKEKPVGCVHHSEENQL